MWRFNITIIKNGCFRYKIYDCKTGKTVFCDINKLNNTLIELMEKG